MLPVKTTLQTLILLFAVGTALGQETAKDSVPDIEFPNVAVSASLRPTEQSFRNGTFSEYAYNNDMRMNVSFSARLRNGQFKKKYKPFGSNEVWLTGFHDVSEAGAVFAIAEYHELSIGGSSSNDCYVQVVRFKKGSKTLLVQQIYFGCDSEGSGSTVSADGRELTTKEGVKWDSELVVFRFRWNGSQFTVAEHSTEPVTKNH